MTESWGGGQWRNRGGGSNCDSAGLPGLLSLRLFTLLTFEAREEGREKKKKKVGNVVQVSPGKRLDCVGSWDVCLFLRLPFGASSPQRGGGRGGEQIQETN